MLWFCAATIRLCVSIFKSPFWSQTQFYSLLTSLVCLKYWPCKAFPSQSCNLFSFFPFFKTFAASKPSTLSPLASDISLSSPPWTYTYKPLNCQLYTILNSYQPSFFIFSRYTQSVNIKLWLQSSMYFKELPSFSIYSLQLTLFPTNKCCGIS